MRLVLATTAIRFSSRSFSSRHNMRQINQLIGGALFVAVPLLLAAKSAYHTTAPSGQNKASTYKISDGESIVAHMEKLVQNDEGGRGIGEILLPSGELRDAAQTMLSAKRVAIITGFPCMMKFTPPTETDGPLGALALSKCLLALGKDVVVVTDECNEEVLLACASSTRLHKADIPGIPSGHFGMESFPAATQFDEADELRLQSLTDSVDLVIAIERSGPCKDGTYLTMRGYDMSHLVAPLELMLMPPGVMDEVDRMEAEQNGEAAESKIGAQVGKGPLSRAPRSIGIGDGGNEVGMGKIYERVVASKITNAALIGCVVPTDHLLVCSVSNWGGYALAAAAAVLSRLDGRQGVAVTRAELLERLARCVPSTEEETAKCKAIVEAGARDGVSGALDLFIDGMPLQTSLEILRKLRELDFDGNSDK